MDIYITEARKAIESMYDRTCDVVERKARQNPTTKRTEYAEETVLEGQKCRISYKAIYSSNQSEAPNNISQTTKLFIAPEVKIKPGSKIIVTKGDLIEAYKNSGIPAMYDTHQEIVLDEFKGWA